MPLPTIKGLFVNSHIKILRKIKGEEAVKELEKRYGAPIKFKIWENVPVREEVKIIELVLDLLSDNPVPPENRAFEAGRLHFRNFATTPFGKIVLSSGKSFKTIMLRSPNIAIHVFKNVRFTITDTGKKSIKIIMENNDYPIDHFKGLFYEWMTYRGNKGIVEAKALSPTTFEYYVEWE